jgi:hypothetical protein
LRPCGSIAFVFTARFAQVARGARREERLPAAVPPTEDIVVLLLLFASNSGTQRLHRFNRNDHFGDFLWDHHIVECIQPILSAFEIQQNFLGHNYLIADRYSFV